jgi:hypothetical protein
VFGKNSSDDIFVDLDPESERDDVCDARTTKSRVALLKLNDGCNEFPRRTSRPGSFVTSVAEQAAIFMLDQSMVEFEQSRWFDDYRYSE